MNVEQTNFVTHLINTAVPDPDPYIRGAGGGGRSPKKIFPPFGPQFGLPLYSTIILLNISESVC